LSFKLGVFYEYCRANGSIKKSWLKTIILKGQGYRDLLSFIVGLTALRVSDLPQFLIGDFVDKDGEVREHFWLHG
jgi:hypothetical protein